MSELVRCGLRWEPHVQSSECSHPVLYREDKEEVKKMATVSVTVTADIELELEVDLEEEAREELGSLLGSTSFEIQDVTENS